jgi:PAS domain S-box-containing protein
MIFATLRRYGFAAMSCGLALALAWPLDAPSSCFFLAVMASSLLGGKGPGLLSVGLSALAFDYFFLPPRFQLAIQPNSYFRFTVFLGAILLVTGIIEIKRRVEESRRNEREQAESALRKSESYLAEAQTLSHTGSWAWDVNRQEIVYWSAEMFRIYERDPSEGLPSTREFSAMHAPQDWANLMDLAHCSVRERADMGYAFQFVSSDGSLKHIRIVGHPVVTAKGDVCELLGTAIDVTEQHKMRTALEKAFADLKRSEDDLREIVNTIPTLAWSARPDGSGEFFNRRWLDYTGLSADQARDWGWKAAVHPGDVNALVQYWQSVLASGKPGEIDARLRQADGEYRWFLFRTSPLHDESGRAVKWYGINIDIEDRRRAEEAVKARERDLGLIIETLPALVWCAAPDGELTYVNGRVLDYIGTTLESLARSGWLNFLHPDDVEPTVRAWSYAVAAGQPHEIQYRLQRFDGTYRWFHVLGQLVRDSEGHTTRWYGLLIDIDDRKKTEETLRSTQTQLSRATQIATIGEFAAAIAHEINQPLAAVVANGHACLRWLAAQPPNLFKGQQAAERIVRDGREAGEVVQRIRALFKRAALEQSALDLNEIIGEVLRLLDGETRKRRVAVETDLEKGLARVVGDRVQLQQVVFNLLLNGLEAMDPVIDSPKKLSIRSKGQSQEMVLVEIRDYGVGLHDPEKVFEAFFTTKENGMGMGLAICRSIIEAHHGRLWAAPAEETGASFCFTLPAQSGATL